MRYFIALFIFIVSANVIAQPFDIITTEERIAVGEPLLVKGYIQIDSDFLSANKISIEDININLAAVDGDGKTYILGDEVYKSLDISINKDKDNDRIGFEVKTNDPLPEIDDSFDIVVLLSANESEPEAIPIAEPEPAQPTVVDIPKPASQAWRKMDIIEGDSLRNASYAIWQLYYSDTDLTIEQIMTAVQRYNPQAFNSSEDFKLQTNLKIHIPSFNQANEQSAEDAKAFIDYYYQESRLELEVQDNTANSNSEAEITTTDAWDDIVSNEYEANNFDFEVGYQENSESSFLSDIFEFLYNDPLLVLFVGGLFVLIFFIIRVMRHNPEDYSDISEPPYTIPQHTDTARLLELAKQAFERQEFGEARAMLNSAINHVHATPEQINYAKNLLQQCP